MSAELESVMRELAREELMEMKLRGFDYVKGLAVPYRREERLGGKKMVMTIWREEIKDWQVRVVVQVDQKRMFGREGLRILDGFRLTDAGEVRGIKAEDLDKYR
jgi:hypothetical protein